MRGAILILLHLVKEVGARVPRLYVLLLIVPCPIINQLIGFAVLHGYFKERRLEVGECRACITFQDELLVLTQAVIISVPNPLLALFILPQYVMVQPQQNIFTESKLHFAHVNMRNIVPLLALANEELTAGTE